MMKYLLAGAAFAVLAASPAAARDHSAYFGLEVGPMWVKDSKATIDLIDGTDTLRIDHKMGVDGDLIAGYDFGIIRAEVELAHKWAKHDTYQFNGGSTFDADGHSRAYSAMGNVLIDLGKNDTVNFYAGGGAGIAWRRTKYRDVEDTFEEHDSVKDSGFAWQIIAGVRAPVFRHFDVGLKYRYFRGPKLRDDDFFGDPIRINAWQSHSLLASLIYNFADIEAPPPPPPPPPPATQTCPDGTVILATDTCPAPPPPPPPPAATPERGS